MRPLLPKHFLRRFPKRSVLTGTQRAVKAIAKQPTLIATAISLGLHAGLAASIPQLLPDASAEAETEAIETDVIALSPEDLAAFSDRATAPAQPSRSSRDFTDLNGRSLPNLSREDDDEPKARTSGASSFGWGSASSYYDWDSRDTDDDTQYYDATREDDFYRYWEQIEAVRDRLDSSDATVGQGVEGGEGGEEGGEGEGGGDKGLDDGPSGGGGEGDGGDAGFNSGEGYRAGIDSRLRYAEWALAVRESKGLPEEAIEPTFIPIEIPVPNDDGFQNLIGQQGVAGLLVAPTGRIDSLFPITEFSANELARLLLRDFVLSGFDGCNLGVSRDTWTACGLDITFVGGGARPPEGGQPDIDPDGEQSGSEPDDVPNPSPSGAPDPNGDAPDPGSNPSPNSPPEAVPHPLLALARNFEPETPVAVALTEAAPSYDIWRAEVADRLGAARSENLDFRVAPSVLAYPDDLEPDFDRTAATTAIVALAIDPAANPIPGTLRLLRSTGRDRLDGLAIQYAETTPQSWYVERFELAGDRDTIVTFAVSFEEPANDPDVPDSDGAPENEAPSDDTAGGGPEP